MITLCYMYVYSVDCNPGKNVESAMAAMVWLS